MYLKDLSNEIDKIDCLKKAGFFRQSVRKILNISKFYNSLFGILEIPQ